MDWSGVDYCDVFIRLSFWRHPFTAEHPLLRHWCRDTFLQTWWRNKLISEGLRWAHFWMNCSFKHVMSCDCVRILFNVIFSKLVFLSKLNHVCCQSVANIGFCSLTLCQCYRFISERSPNCVIVIKQVVFADTCTQRKSDGDTTGSAAQRLMHCLNSTFLHIGFYSRWLLCQWLVRNYSSLVLKQAFCDVRIYIEQHMNI